MPKRIAAKRVCAFVALMFGLSLAGFGLPRAATAPAGPAPQEVRAGVYVNNIPTVELPRNSFNADFYLWFRWRDGPTDLAKDITDGVRVINVYERWALETEPVYDEPQTEPDGSKLWIVHYHGNFSTPLSLKRYPFDSQNLKLIIENETLNSRRVVFKPDDSPIRLGPDITLPGYRIDTPRISFGDFTYDVGPADRVEQDWTFPRITVEVPMSPPLASGIIKIFVPIVIVLAAAAAAMVVPASHVDSKIAIPITALLALVAMHWGVSSSLPDAGYLLMIDVLYIVAYAAATTFLAAAIGCAWLVDSRGVAAADSQQRRLLVVICIVYLVVVAAILLGYVAR